MQRLDFIRPISDVSSNGLDGFYLPVEEECADDFLNSSMDVLGSVAFELASSDQALADALWLIKPYVGLDAATIFFNAMQLTVLQRDPANRSIQSFSSQIISSFAEGKPTVGPLAASFSKPIRRESLISNTVRWATAPLRADGMARPFPFNHQRKTDILCFWATPFMVDYSQTAGKRLCLAKISQWYSLPDRQETYTGAVDVAQIVSDRLSLLANQLLPAISPLFRESVSRSTLILLNVTTLLLQQLKKKAGWLPDNIWLTSTGSIFSRLMAYMARQHDVHCVIHDHGCGSGFMDLRLVKDLELSLGDEMLTFSDMQAKGAISLQVRHADKRVVRPPNIVKSPYNLFEKNFYSATSIAGGKEMNVIYAPSIYDGDRYRSPPLLNDAVAVDYQARLLHSLSRMGHRVNVKAHPESLHEMPKGLLQIGDCQKVVRRFEACLEEIDLILIDYPASTVIRSALHSNIPIVVIDFNRIPILPFMREVLEKRVSFLRTWRDEEFRVRFDDRELQLAIEEAQAKASDLVCVEKFYG